MYVRSGWYYRLPQQRQNLPNPTYIYIPVCHLQQAGTCAIMKTGKSRREQPTSEKQNKEKELQVSSTSVLRRASIGGGCPPSLGTALRGCQRTSFTGFHFQCAHSDTDQAKAKPPSAEPVSAKKAGRGSCGTAQNSDIGGYCAGIQHRFHRLCR